MLRLCSRDVGAHNFFAENTLNPGILACTTMLHNDSVMFCASNSMGCSFLWITYLLSLQTMSIWYKIKVMDAKWTREWGEDTVVHWLTKLLWGYLNASLAFYSAWPIIDEFCDDSALEKLTCSVPCEMLVTTWVWWWHVIKQFPG